MSDSQDVVPILGKIVGKKRSKNLNYNARCYDLEVTQKLKVNYEQDFSNKSQWNIMTVTSREPCRSGRPGRAGTGRAWNEAAFSPKMRSR